MAERRKLTEAESHILDLVRQLYGNQNTEDDVFFPTETEAAIFVKAPNGVIPIMVNLTNLAMFLAEGHIKSEDELINKWLIPQREKTGSKITQILRKLFKNLLKLFKTS